MTITKILEEMADKYGNDKIVEFIPLVFEYLNRQYSEGLTNEGQDSEMYLLQREYYRLKNKIKNTIDVH